MVLTAERTTAAESPTRPWWKRPSTIAIVLALVIVAVVGIVAVVNSGDDGTMEPVETVDDVYDRIAAALATVDPANADLIHTGLSDIVRPNLMGWQISILGLDPVFTDCSGSTNVICDLAYGEDYFYSVVVGHNVAGSATMRVYPNGNFAITAWPFPEEVKAVERDLRDWVRDTHPELESRMFGAEAYGVFKFTEEALQLHMDYLDEYLAYLDA